MTSITLADIKTAARRISGLAVNTPLVPSPHLSDHTGHEVLFKMESLQPVGAFKLRGAANALANLPKGARGVVCCSTGNHGRAIAYAAAKSGLRAVICMTDKAPRTKVEAIRALGAEVRQIDGTQDDAQAEVERLVTAEGLVDISPFDDPHVIAGQGTIALELLQSRPDLANIILPLSGGGLAAGVAIAAKSLSPAIRIVGATMQNGAAMHASIRQGRPVDVAEYGSLADSLGGGIFDNNRHTLRICSELLDDSVLVSEEAIYRAMQTLYFEDRLIAEGGAAVGPAALLGGQIGNISGPTAIILTGRNVDTAMLLDILNGRDLDIKGTKISGSAYRPA